VKKEDEMALQWAEMRTIRWTCGVKVTCGELRDRPGIYDIITVVQ